MENNKTNSSVETGQTAAGFAKNMPLKVIKEDDVSASIFAREYLSKGQMRKFYSVSFSRSYRDSVGKWKYIKSFNLEDLGKVVSVSKQSDDYIRGLQNA